MRISDWSSDVCSSDLDPFSMRRSCRYLSRTDLQNPCEKTWHVAHLRGWKGAAASGHTATNSDTHCSAAVDGGGPGLLNFAKGPERRRSEEHTSELQSLMRSSYAVFCLKKQK